MIIGCETKNILSITKLYTFFEKHFESGYFFRGESHNFYEIVCVLSGEVGITAGKRVFILKEGEMTFHPPGEFHAIWEENSSQPDVIVFSFSAHPFPRIAGKIFNIGEEGKKESRNLLRLVKDCFLTRKSYIEKIKDGAEIQSALVLKKLEIFILNYLCDSWGNEANNFSNSSEIFSNIISVMESNLEASLDINKIATHCKISVSTLEKTVYKYLGYGAITHYNTLKMHKAQAMLINGSNVKETALSLGFSNQNYFSARFKKYYGYSPSSLKKCK